MSVPGAPVNRLLEKRRSGILLHPTSLPGPGPVGRLGDEARRFVDWMVSAGFSVWQILPVNPPQQGGSPYACISAFAGDTRLIDPGMLVEAGWLPPGSERWPLGQALSEARAALMADGGDDWQDYLRFCHDQDDWLDDFALFVVIKRLESGRPWWQWPEPLRDWSARRLEQLRAEMPEALDAVRFGQFVFFRQWRALREYANARDVLLLGDMPIFVAHDSADVWAHPDDFDLDAKGQPNTVTGVPPDYFSETGQRWGNPQFRWGRMKEAGYAWWLRRIEWALAGVDALRIDHFRGFESYWSIPASEPTAIAGQWEPGPGADFFEALLARFGELPLLAEDLGVITPEVTALRDRFGLPGMMILQFAFDGGDDNPYLPQNHVQCGVVYTGTHDNDTTVGWFEALEPERRAHVLEVLGNPAEPMPWALVRAALTSPAQVAIIPMQDALALDGRHRMNTPGTSDGNWTWRFDWSQVPDRRAEELRQMNEEAGRIPAV
ncbi:4-alpha-glucanotransferase (amylomaltase) [Thioalkalivibrio nitratireducens DSM 14787]|uniref:4-alpha-glucanotransferase n=1 Tax=Thioalkalivibrio nitratireducens (strain DSM 14787 / UNIQEM 213 / ALEN2) TaxID=1255043 RepID=L0DV92_THIND|nr:4-alpha-glucanotransferase [Thioalkalivibrio nitratireducens]AGA32943.1 4-alpha-glucanotransferase (amylomaltase) [Thioalkalivibrio nitratireducens DSM 14787]